MTKYVFYIKKTDSPLGKVGFIQQVKSKNLTYFDNAVATSTTYNYVVLEELQHHYLLNAVATSTATATVAPTIGLLPIPKNPIIST